MTIAQQLDGIDELLRRSDRADSNRDAISYLIRVCEQQNNVIRALLVKGWAETDPDHGLAELIGQNGEAK